MVFGLSHVNWQTTDFAFFLPLPPSAIGDQKKFYWSVVKQGKASSTAWTLTSIIFEKLPMNPHPPPPSPPHVAGYFTRFLIIPAAAS
ncbi:hypothetical protein NC653_001643 [Populus alba x Populus x berolinensis]|uniref:Uncharacterized protein n=1 Tax=Populus alba x Populus x berolinensis TaxID=444605 RepID=A0AAD6WI49_9ROSI|nr:hypothetical protein NC653_001643 [Populus alba x Populus x berolinensis]